MSFSREVRDSWMCRSISPSLAPTFGREKGGEKKEEELAGLPAGSGARRKWVKALAHVPAQLPPAPVCAHLRLAPAGWPVGAWPASGWRAGWHGGAPASPPSARPWRAMGGGRQCRQKRVNRVHPFRGKKHYGNRANRGNSQRELGRLPGYVDSCLVM